MKRELEREERKRFGAFEDDKLLMLPLVYVLLVCVCENVALVTNRLNIFKPTLLGYCIIYFI